MQSNILLTVEDKPDTISLLSELAAKYFPEYRLLTAASTEEGLALASERDVDGVILDVRSPRIDGLEMCRRLKADERTAHIPIALLTDHISSPEFFAQCLEAGADDFIANPNGGVELAAKIRVLLRMKKAEDNLRALNARMDEIVEERTRELLESERKYRFLSENVQDVIWTIDNDFRFTYISPSIRYLRGYEPEEAIMQTFEETMTPESHQLVQEAYARYLEAEAQGRINKIDYLEIQQKRKDGSLVWVEIKIQPILNNKGQRIGFIGVNREIAERKRAKEALRESEGRVRANIDVILSPEGDMGALELSDIINVPAIQAIMNSFFRITHIGIGIIDLYGKVLVATGWQDICTKFHRIHAETNKYCVESDLELSSGIKPGAFQLYKCKNNMWDLATPIVIGGKHVGNIFLGQFLFDDETPDYIAFRGQARRYGFDEEEYIAALDRVPRWSRETVNNVMTFYAQLANLISTQSYSNIKLAQTLAGRKQAEEALRKSEEWRRTVLRKAMDGFWVVDLQGRLLEVNETYCRMSGYSAQELLAMRINDLDVLETIDVTASRIQKIMAQSEERFESQHRRKDGSIFDVEISAQFQPAEGGRFVVFLRDITERKRAEAALQEQIRLNKIFMDSMPCAALLIHPITRKIVAANRKGMEAGAVLGTQCFNTWIKRDDPCPWCLAVEKRTCGPPQQREVEHHGAIWDVHWIPVSEDLFLHYAFDITEKRQMEKQLLQAQKLEALGTLSGGIAHDFNNILTAIMGYTHLAYSSNHDPELVLEYLSIVLKASERAKNLIGQILAFSRKHDMDKHPFPIDLTIKEGLKLLRSTLPTTIEIKQNIDSDSMVMGDLNQIHQILMNLCMNAAHAMRDQGNLLEVSLIDREIQENIPLPLSDLPPGKYVCLTVKDNGHGIDPLIRDRIFDPFFTTKDKSEGTGLGLSVVLGIVKNHNGGIQLDSVLGQGTTFYVYLPVCNDAEKKQKENTSLQMGNGEWILFSDDEEYLRDLGRKMLETLGYRSVVCADGKEALEAFLLDPMKFALVMTDQTMPRMTGMQLAQEILHRRPDIPILLYTGYDERVTSESAAAAGIRDVEMKPVSIEHLSIVLAKLLSAKN
ncbi:MAG: PocR ligand-binding domain-containing protein [Candidatus Omnitrophota bacterium]